MPKKDQQGYYGFDPSGLERAAQVTPIIARYITLTLGCQISRSEPQC